MRLPGALYGAVKHYMMGHASWHIARLNPAQFDPDEQAAIADARQMFPDAICVINPGAGEQFLEFHRDMLRQFKWIVIDTAEPGFQFDEWTELPDWVSQRFEAGFLDGVAAALPALIAGPSVDDLGAFLESIPRCRWQFRDVHNKSHGVIAAAEAALYPGDQRRVDASMLEMAEAPHNENFWSLHSWIDSHYAAWQQAHGIPVDVSPKKPMGHHH